jgi:hypothetical protein
MYWRSSRTSPVGTLSNPVSSLGLFPCAHFQTLAPNDRPRNFYPVVLLLLPCHRRMFAILRQQSHAVHAGDEGYYVPTRSGRTIHAHARCSTSGRTSRHNTRKTLSDAHRFHGGTWRSEPDADAHIRRRCNPPPYRLWSPCLGWSYIAPVRDMSHAGAFEKKSLSTRATITSRVLSCQ